MTPWLLSLHGIGRASGLQTASAICVLPLTTASMLPPARAGGIRARVAAEIAKSAATALRQSGPATAADRTPHRRVTGDVPACPAPDRPSPVGSLLQTRPGSGARRRTRRSLP